MTAPPAAVTWGLCPQQGNGCASKFLRAPSIWPVALSAELPSALSMAAQRGTWRANPPCQTLRTRTPTLLLLSRMESFGLMTRSQPEASQDPAVEIHGTGSAAILPHFRA